MPTQIGSRQLRSSSAHCARKLAKRLAKSWQGGSGRGSGGRGGGGERRRRGGEGGGRGGRGEGGTTVLKSNNPHLAGGEKQPHFIVYFNDTPLYNLVYMYKCKYIYIYI